MGGAALDTVAGTPPRAAVYYADMRRLLVLVLAGAAALGVPAVAAAKEITRVRVCGPVACADVTGGGPARSDAAAGGLSWPRPVRPAPFYVVRYTVGLAPGEGGRARTGWTCAGCRRRTACACAARAAGPSG